MVIALKYQLCVFWLVLYDIDNGVIKEFIIGSFFKPKIIISYVFCLIYAHLIKFILMLRNDYCFGACLRKLILFFFEIYVLWTKVHYRKVFKRRLLLYF